MSGDETEHVLTLRDWLVELVSESKAGTSECAPSIMTPAPSRRSPQRSPAIPPSNMPITAVFIDEVQVPLENRTPLLVESKKVPVGNTLVSC